MIGFVLGVIVGALAVWIARPVSEADRAAYDKWQFDESWA